MEPARAGPLETSDPSRRATALVAPKGRATPFRGLLRTVGAFFAFVIGSGLALAAGWASARSLYWPDAGERLPFDASLGFVGGALLALGGVVLHARTAARDPEAAPLISVTLGACVLAFLSSTALSYAAEQVARHSSGWMDGVEYFGFFGIGAGWAVMMMVFARRTRGYFTSIAITAAGFGAASMLFSVYLLAKTQELRAVARARNARVPGAELALILAVVVVAALLHRRRSRARPSS